jgi:hypothetical protein
MAIGLWRPSNEESELRAALLGTTGASGGGGATLGDGGPISMKLPGRQSTMAWQPKQPH